MPQPIPATPAPPQSAAPAKPAAAATPPPASAPAKHSGPKGLTLENISTDNPAKGDSAEPTVAPQIETKPPVKETKPPSTETESDSDDTTGVETETAEPTGSLGDDLDSVLRKPKPGKQQNGSGTPKQLREAYEAQKKELATHQAKVRELEAAVAKAADEGRVKAETALQKRLDELVADRDRLDSEMRFTRYESSSEFKNNYQKPIQAAWALAERDLDGVRVMTSDGNDRAATLDDIAGLLQLPASQARRQAAAMFGEDAQIVMGHRDRLREKIDSMNSARAEWREKGSKMQAEMQEAQTRQQKDFHDRIDYKMKELSDIAPEIFGDPKDNPEESSLVQKASDLVDVAMGRKGFKDGTPPEEQARGRADAIALVAARAKHFGRLVYQVNSLKEKLAAAEEKLKGYESSEPTPTPTSVDKPTKLMSANEGLAALAVNSP